MQYHHKINLNKYLHQVVGIYCKNINIVLSLSIWRIIGLVSSNYLEIYCEYSTGPSHRTDFSPDLEKFLAFPGTVLGPVQGQSCTLYMEKYLVAPSYFSKIFGLLAGREIFLITYHCYFTPFSHFSPKKGGY